MIVLPLFHCSRITIFSYSASKILISYRTYRFELSSLHDLNWSIVHIFKPPGELLIQFYNKTLINFGFSQELSFIVVG